MREATNNGNTLKPKRVKKKSTIPVATENQHQTDYSLGLVVAASYDDDDHDDLPLLKRTASTKKLKNRTNNKSPARTRAPLPPTTSKQPIDPNVNTSHRSIRTSIGRILERRSERQTEPHRQPAPEKQQQQPSQPEQISRVVWPKNIATVSVDDDEELSPPLASEEDPVMALFQSYSTHRVRFATPPKMVKARDEKVDHAPSSPVRAGTKTNGDRNGTETNRSKSGFQLKQFMRRSLFTSGTSKTGKGLTKEEAQEVMNEPEFQGVNKSSLIWESPEAEAIHTTTSRVSGSNSPGSLVCIAEDPATRMAVAKLLSKAKRAQEIHFRYEYAVKCFVKALDILTKAKYPEDHPTVQKALKSLNQAHHALNSFKNSANIVKMGIRCEEAGELVRALKMYTIAYRIRRDNLGRNHPSLIILLNMLGNIQIKRGELDEAIEIYHLALQDGPSMTECDSTDEDEEKPPVNNLLPKSVSYRDIGTIYEQWGKVDDAMKMYHRSLQCVTEWKEYVGTTSNSPQNTSDIHQNSTASTEANYSLKDLQLSKSSHLNLDQAGCGVSSEEGEKGEMELFFGKSSKNRQPRAPLGPSPYDIYFPPYLDNLDESSKANRQQGKKASVRESRQTYADVDVALTIHQIAQLHRSMGHFKQALDAYHVALRGMKHTLGRLHPNVAAILGNIGNLQKEMGDLDAAFDTYQEVLGIESYRLGLSHPEVTISLHNIATIEAARGNYEHALTIYRKVLSLQRKLFGEDHSSLAVTATCMGDVFEKIGDVKNGMDSYEEALRIKIMLQGRHHIEVARLLAKLGKMALSTSDLRLADTYVSRAVLIYRLNKLQDKHEWLVDAYRDAADIDAAIALGRSTKTSG